MYVCVKKYSYIMQWSRRRRETDYPLYELKSGLTRCNIVSPLNESNQDYEKDHSDLNDTEDINVRHTERHELYL